MEEIFINHSIAELVLKCQAKELSAKDLLQASISRIKSLESTYQAWAYFDEQFLSQQAIKEPLNFNGLLSGIPIAVKDIFNTVDFPTQMGSPLWKGFTPGNDARVVFNAKRAGAVVVGKTVTAEFAVHTLDKTLNPHDITKTPGTSSSGSAVAVALGMVPAALGTQTAGSIVRPASFCGVYACKPSFGLIPRTGVLKTTDTLDTVGFFAQHACDLRRLFEVFRVSGYDYPVSHAALSDQSRQLKESNRPWRVAFVKTHTWAQVPDYAKEAIGDYIHRISKLSGLEITEVELPLLMQQSHFVHETIYNKTLSYYFKKEFEQSSLVSPIMNNLIKLGQLIGQADYLAALESQTLMQEVMDNFFSDFDIIISASTAGEAPDRDLVEQPDPCLIWTLAHLPVIHVPAFKSPSALPFGLQLVARKYNDYLLLNFLDYLLAERLIPEQSNSCPIN